MTSLKSENHGFRRSVLLVACLFMMIVHACGKNETEQASKISTPAGDAAQKMTAKTQKLTHEVVNSANDIADKASQKANEAYDAVGNTIEKTAENAGDAYKSTADRMKKAVSDASGPSPSAGEITDRMPDRTNDLTQTVEHQVGKQLDRITSPPAK